MDVLVLDVPARSMCSGCSGSGSTNKEVLRYEDPPKLKNTPTPRNFNFFKILRCCRDQRWIQMSGISLGDYGV